MPWKMKDGSCKGGVAELQVCELQGRGRCRLLLNGRYNAAPHTRGCCVLCFSLAVE